jgi:tol-pal system protein YbgF
MLPRHFLLAALLIATVATVPAAAQSRSEAILLGELRQNQEQLTRLTALVTQLAEQMKTLDKRIVDQETATNKGFADQRVTITAQQGTMQTMREKLEDSALRATQATQEIAAVREGVRMLYDQVSVLIGLLQPPAAATNPDASGATSASPRNLPQMPPSPASLIHPAVNDYTSGRYSLAIDGFEEVVKTFPGSPEAAKAQFFIGESYNAVGKAKEAVAAYDKVIANYKDNEYARDAMYMKGVTLLDKLKNPAQARLTWEALIKQYPNSNQAINAEQGLKKIKGGN